MINPVILSGGSGTRLWPLSRASYPKQFLPLVTEKSLFQETLIRLKNNYLDVDEPIIIGNQEHRFLIAEQCRLINVKPNSIILEPFGRNTAAAIATACLNVQNKKGDGILLVMPADHVIENTTAFLDSIKKAISVADQDKIVTFGIAPKYAETGYGYIRVKEKSQYIQKVDAFVEKPDKKTANQYLIDGRYYWNAGIFLFKASAMIAEIEKYSPLVLDSVKKAFDNSKEDADFLRLDSDCFSQVPDISIDYAVMEKSNNVSVMPLDAEWSDVGCWNSVWNISKKDNNNNVIRGNVISEDSENCYIRAESRLVSLLGVNDLIVIETSDALMVAKKDKAQDVKKIVEIAKNNKKPQATIHRKVYRPWGYYDSIDVGVY
jgi:mannose-1-phosphate guanylyltransferase/mannose-6-phosphate isomerase